MTVNYWLPWVLSGFVGAIVGAMIYGWVALHGIRRQVIATVHLHQMGSLEESIAALRALVAELAHNRIQLAQEYEGYRALALTMVMWQNLAPKLGPINIDGLTSISLAYAYISEIKSAEESIRSDLQGRRPAIGHQFIQQAWSAALNSVDAALATIGEEERRLREKHAKLLKDVSPRLAN